MGFLDSVFGGGTETYDPLRPGQKQFLDNASGLLNEQLGRSGPVYGGPMVPGASPLQQQGFQHAGGLMGRGVNTQPAIQRMLSGQADPAAVQEYYQGAVANPAQAGWRNTMDQIGARYGDTYGQSGGLMRGLGQAATDFNTNLSGQLAGLQFGERQGALDRMGQGVGLGLQEQAQYGNNLRTLMGAGGMQRGIEGQQNQAELARWQQGQAYNNPWLQTLGPMVMGAPALGVQQTPSPFSQVTGALGGLGMFGMGLGGLFGG
jgi:hypothetical protein